MPFTQEQTQRITTALKQKTGAGSGCPMCGTKTFQMGDGIVHLTLQSEVGATVLSGPALPCLPVICTNCGATQLLNVFILGVADVLSSAKPDAKKAEG